MQRSARDVLNQYWDRCGRRGEIQPRRWPSTTRTGRARGAMDDSVTSWSSGALRLRILVRLSLKKEAKLSLTFDGEFFQVRSSSHWLLAIQLFRLQNQLL